MERWTGCVAVVTGASAGIGAAIAEELVKKGLKVVGLARRVDKVKELEGSLQSAPGKLYPLKCDITKEQDIKEAFKWVKDNLGGVDILVNNAGGDKKNTLCGGPVDNWRQVLELNVLGLSICTKEAIESMNEKQVDGHIININSVVGHIDLPADFPYYMYSASKHAVTALTEGLRRELVKMKSKIRVTSLSPGVVKTEFQIVAGRTDILNRVHHLESKDIADAALYILGTPPHVQIQELIIKHVGQQL